MNPTRNPEARAAVLYPFQVTGTRWLASQTTALLGDEMGVGKSVQAIRAADALQLRRILVVAPTNAIYNWREEFHKFSLWDRRVQVVPSADTELDPGVDVVVTTHKLITRMRLRLQFARRPWDLVVADECQAFKNPEAARTQFFYGPDCGRVPGSTAALAERVWLLSGTPVQNGANELWSHVRALRPDLITQDGAPMSCEAFTARYCITRQTRYGLKVIGNRTSALGEIRSRVLEPFILRRMKADVLPELPKVRYDLVVLPADGVPDEMKRLERELGPKLRAALADVEKGIGGAEALKRLEQQEASKGGGLARLVRLTGQLKVTHTVAMIEEQFQGYPDEKILVFAKHLDLIDDLVTACEKWNPVHVTGAVTARRRQDAVDTFQTDPRCRVFIGQIDACGTAATLTVASEALFPEASWVPSDNAQAAARMDRIGQTKPMRVRFLALAGSIDEAKMRVLTRKVKLTTELFAA